jgi:hypothetical protein
MNAVHYHSLHQLFMLTRHKSVRLINQGSRISHLEKVLKVCSRKYDGLLQFVTEDINVRYMCGLKMSEYERCPWRCYHRGCGGRLFNAKMHVSEQKFNVRKCKTMRLDESYRLVTTVLVLNSRCGKIHNIFLTTIAVGFLFLSPRCGGGALAFFFYFRGASAVTSAKYILLLSVIHVVNRYFSNL